MTTIPPTPPGVPTGSFPFQVQPYNNITPLTNRDGLTLLEMYRDLRHWLFRELVPYIDGTIADYVDAFNASVGQIAVAITDLHTFVDASKTDIDEKVAAFNTLVTAANTNFNAAVTAALTNIQGRVDAAVVAQHAAEAARDLAAQYATTAGQQVDTNVSAFVTNVQSSTYAALVALVGAQTNDRLNARNPVKITVTHKSTTYGRYAVIRARGGGLMPGTSMLSKRYGSDFDGTNPNSTGVAFKPPGESLDSYARRTGGTVATNASGWNVTNNIGEMRGAQIHNGKIFHDFEANTLAGSPAGVEGIGLLPTGKLKCYSALRGDTAASMLAEGVIESWSYGPNLVVDGVPQDLTTKNWQYYLTEISARTIIGQTSGNDIVIICTVGKTNISGLAGNDMVALAQSEGLVNASLFDGGGSTQAYVAGFYTIPSSDTDSGYDGTFGRRKVGDCFILHGELATSPLDTGWVNIPLRAGYVTNGSNPVPQVRTLEGVTELRGTVKPSTGTFAGDNSSVLIGDLPQQFGHDTGAKGFLVPCNGSNTRKVTVQSDRSIQVVGDVNTPTYVTLDGIRWGTQTI